VAINTDGVAFVKDRAEVLSASPLVAALPLIDG
jgi:hypothetical protein